MLISPDVIVRIRRQNRKLLRLVAKQRDCREANLPVSTDKQRKLEDLLEENITLVNGVLDALTLDGG